MSRTVWTSLALFLVAGCQLPDERSSVRPLPEDTPPLAYAELLTRARHQASAATDAFYYNNNWDTLQEVSRALEQTARFLGRATDVPEKQRDTLPASAIDLGKYAVQLREAADKHEVDKTKEILQKINLKVRELRQDG